MSNILSTLFKSQIPVTRSNSFQLGTYESRFTFKFYLNLNDKIITAKVRLTFHEESYHICDEFLTN